MTVCFRGNRNAVVLGFPQAYVRERGFWRLLVSHLLRYPAYAVSRFLVFFSDAEGNKSKCVIKCGYYSSLSYDEVASAVLLGPLLLMPVGMINATNDRGNSLSLELQGPSNISLLKLHLRCGGCSIVLPGLRTCTTRCSCVSKNYSFLFSIIVSF